MRVLQVIDSLHWGGAQELLVTLAGAAQGSDISLSVANLRGDEDTPYRTRLEKLGVPVQTFPAKKILNPKRFWALSRLMRNESFDLVHTHLMYSNIVGAIGARMYGIPTIATLHVPSIEKNRLRKELNAWVLRNLMHRVVAVGTSIAESYSDALKSKPIRVIPNAVSLTPPLSAEERMKIRYEMIDGAQGPILITVGRLDEAKGYEDLLKGMIELRRVYPSLHLLIVGAGGFYFTLEKQIQNQELAENVHLLGGRDDVPRLLAASDIYVSASYIEGMSISILEAMAAELPIVATCVGENSKLILPTTGILVPVRNSRALAEAIAKMVESPELRTSFGAEARSLVSKLYNVESWFAQIRNLYKDVVEGNHEHS